MQYSGNLIEQSASRIVKRFSQSRDAVTLARKACAKQVKSGHGSCVDCSCVRIEHLAFVDVMDRPIAFLGIGIDFTARDLQDQCKKAGHPWEIAKAFDYSAAVSPFIPKEELGDLTNLEFRLEKNGVVVQRGNTADMLFSFDKLISYVSGYVSFRIGDLLFTGTPAGVGSVVIGDRLTAYLGDRLMLDFLIR